MTSVLAVLWDWKVAFGVVVAAALVWFVLAVFVASRWPALHPAMARFRSSPWKPVAVGMVVGAVLGSRQAFAAARGSFRADQHDGASSTPGAGRPHLALLL